jgi:benzoyl-CoA reductase subunit B
MAMRHTYQDAGKHLQRELLGRYYADLAKAKERDELVAYLFVPGNVVEIPRVFGVHAVFPEINALQCGIKKAAGPLILKAEDMGYSSDVCGYVKNDIGLMLSDGASPFGKIPKPDVLVCNFSGCNTFIKWFEALAFFHDTPMYLLDVPYVRQPTPRKEDVDYVEAQLWELVAFLEERTGQSFDKDRFREIIRLSRAAEDLWAEILAMAREVPSPFDAYFEAVFFMAPINILRGTEDCVRYYETVREEMRERMETGLGPVPEEKVRAVFEGPPCWPHFRAFWELFKKWGVVGVASTYSKVGGLFDQGFRHDPARPMESMAEYVINCYTNWDLPHRSALLDGYVRDYRADALVIHSVKSCRSFSVGQADFRDRFIHELDVPTLMIESDLADPRYFGEAQLRNRVDAFFESLEHKRLTGGG